MKNQFNKLIPALALGGLVFLAACSNNGSNGNDFTVSETGVEYLILTQNEGETADSGDIVSVHMIAKTDSDSAFINTYTAGRPVEINVVSKYQGSLEEGMMFLTTGDSALIRVSADSLFTKQFGESLPEFIPSGSKITFNIKVKDIFSPEELQAKRDQELQELKEKELVERSAFLDSLKQRVNVQSTASGLHYIVESPGEGAPVQDNDTVTVHYTGKFLNGQVFDSSIGQQPMTLIAQKGRAIDGFIEGLKLMNQGQKMTLVLPSEIAYGQYGQRGIPPCQTLVFEVEMVKIARSK